jgi:hypothetical protein
MGCAVKPIGFPFALFAALTVLAGCALPAFDAAGKICGALSACPEPLVCTRLAADQNQRCRARCTEAAAEGECYLNDDGKPARAFYVALDGGDTSVGSFEQPMKTIQAALLRMRGGDILFIRGGTYNEEVNSNFFLMPGGYSWEEPLVVTGMPGEVATLAPDGRCFGVVIQQSRIAYMVWENLVIDGAKLCQSAGYGQGFSLGPDVQNIRLTEIEVMNAPASGLYFSRGSQVEVRRCKLHGNGYGGACPTDGQACAPQAQVAGQHVLIEGCEVYDGPAVGLQLYSSAVPHLMTDNTFRNNVIYETGKKVGSSSGIYVATGNKALIYNNVVYRNSHGIMVAYSNNTDSRVLHNTIVGNQHAGLYFFGGAVRIQAINNLLFGNPIADDTPDAGVDKRNNFEGDPKFVDGPRDDYHLAPSSPAIDYGTVVEQVTTDFDGVSRPQGAAPDVGAFEVR